MKSDYSNTSDATNKTSDNSAQKQSGLVFLHGCGLPELWANQPQWRILETGFGLGLNFLLAWHAWLNDPARCGMLHFLSVEAAPASAADVVHAAQSHPHLQPLANQLAAQWWGLLPGFHRLVFAGGHVLLTLGIGETHKLLRDQSPGFAADSIFIHAANPQRNPEIGDVQTYKAVARCARPGSRVVAGGVVDGSVQKALRQAGFVLQKVTGTAPASDNVQGQYHPPWQVKKRPATSALAHVLPWPAQWAQTAMVIGAGLAGAAVAASLARRGWQVTVLESGLTAASGASSLPAGVLAAHVSRGDTSVLSALSRCGVRATLAQAEALLTAGQDWQCTGVLQRLGLDAGLDNPGEAAGFYRQGVSEVFQADWSRAASALERFQAGLSTSDTAPALWHPRAGWIKPAALVHAWLALPSVRLQVDAHVKQILPAGSGWQALDASGNCLAQASLVVLAAGIDCQTLAWTDPAVPALRLQPIRGQVSWGFIGSATPGLAELPPFPINGLGSLIAGVPFPSLPAALDAAPPCSASAVGPATQQRVWLAGASYARDNRSLLPSAADHAQNWQRLQTLAPGAAQTLATFFKSGSETALHSWTGVRCASPNRLPLVGPLQFSPDGRAAWWICTAMGSRGLTFAALCAELLAAQLHGEPLATGRKLADAMTTSNSASAAE